ncbi:hypothetical protein APT23_05690 [Escherichia coli]|nr:hypothetical protein APT23_05690 [Escherichia coli]
MNAVSGLPAGRAKRVNPPLTAIFKEELVRKYGLQKSHRMSVHFTSQGQIKMVVSEKALVRA